MQKLIWILLTFTTCFLIAEERKEPKTLILIIATDDKPAYRELQKVWESYMNSDPAHFEAYFVRADINLPSISVVKKNEIIVKTQEGFAPGILNKSLMAIDAMQPRLKEFDFVIRTNLSSLFYYPNLLKLMSTLPKKGCFCGLSMYQTREFGLPPEFDYIPFVSGAAIYMSTDTAELLAKDKDLEKYKAQLPDDVYIGLVMLKNKITTINAQRSDFPTRQAWLENKDKIPSNAYHFRAKYSYDPRTAEDPFEEELLTLKELVKQYYNITLE